MIINVDLTFAVLLYYDSTFIQDFRIFEKYYAVSSFGLQSKTLNYQTACICFLCYYIDIPATFELAHI